VLKANVFIVGETKTGKTYLANSLAAKGLKVISASEWVKQRFVPSPAAREDASTYLLEITDYSKTVLRDDPDVCVNFIRRTYPIEEGGFIIEGLRNPRDFALLYRPKIDSVIFLHYERGPNTTSFERQGVAAIHKYVEWLEWQGITDCGLINRYRIAAYAYKGDRSESPALRVPGPLNYIACWDLSDLSFEVIEHGLNLREIPTPETGLVQVPIRPFPVMVAERVFYNDLPEYDKWVDCSAFGLSSYKEHALTLQVLNKGAIFSYVPFHRVLHKPLEGEAFDLKDIVYARCPDDHITVTRYKELVGKPCQAYLKNPKVWLNAEYVMTVDWYKCNDLAHIMALENGQFALLPSHKILVGVGPDQRTLPDYKKLRSEWAVDGSSFEGYDPPQ
jgi:hypothetical protein